jgi:hypothetical protein
MFDIRRREFVTLLGGVAAAWPLAARAQQGARVRRVGIVMPYPKGDSEYEARVRAFKQELAKLGWTDGGKSASTSIGPQTIWISCGRMRQLWWRRIRTSS